MKQGLILAFIICVALTAYGQHESMVWYFGNKAGIMFKDGVPSALTDGALDSFEGCSSISDYTGNILFYTNGSQVWNKKHMLMAGAGNLKGHESSTQSSLIIAKPYTPNYYYIFTTSALEKGVANELAYSIVDMTRDEGLGAVGTKDVILHQPVTERLTAVQHANMRN